MKIEYIKEYITLAEKLNFSETAKEMYVTQSALSKHISYIEEELGVQLFIRTTHAVYLTPEGRTVYEVFKKIFTEYSLLISKMQAVSSGIVGNMNIGILYYCISEYLDPLAKQFNKKYPNINLSIKSCQPYQVIQYLSKDIIDIGLIMHTQFLPADKYNFHILKKEKLFAITLREHPFAKKRCISLNEIAQEKLVLLTLDKEYSEEIIQLLRKNNALSKTIVYTEQIDTLPLELEKVNGVFIGTETLRNIPRKDLVFSEIDCDNLYLEIGYAYKKSNSNRFIQFFLKPWGEFDYCNL